MYQQRFKSLEQRFWEKVVVQEKDKCWAWIGSSGKTGRGVMWNGTRNEFAPRISWRLAKGDVQLGLSVLHKCDNPNCVNPSHLFLGTQKDNVHDAINKGRFAQNSARRGEDHHFAKLSKEGVKNLLSMRAQGATFAELGKMFGISKSQAYRIVRGLRWGNRKETGELRPEDR